MAEKLTRRGFLRNASVTAAGMPLASSGVAAAWASRTHANASNSPTEVPNTLDLTERAELALNGLIGTMDQEHVPEFYFNDYDDNSEWLGRARKIGDKLGEIAISKDDYIYYPTTPGYGDVFSYPKSGWKVTELLTKPQPNMAGVPDDTFGIPMYLGGTILPLVRLAERLQDEKTLEVARKLTRFMLLPESGRKPGQFARGINPAEHGVYRGHFHGHVMALRGILAYGVAVNDTSMKQFARDGYEFSRNLGIAPLGWFEEHAGKHSHETCGLADMVSLAIQLSTAGLGDYWDDVDGFVRNHLTEGQFVDLDKLKKMNPDMSANQEKLLGRAIGTFGSIGSPVALSMIVRNCCVANGTQALYAA